MGVLIAEMEPAVRRRQAQPDIRPIAPCAIGTPEQVAELLLRIVEQGRIG